MTSTTICWKEISRFFEDRLDVGNDLAIQEVTGKQVDRQFQIRVVAIELADLFRRHAHHVPGHVEDVTIVLRIGHELARRDTIMPFGRRQRIRISQPRKTASSRYP